MAWRVSHLLGALVILRTVFVNNNSPADFHSRVLEMCSEQMEKDQARKSSGVPVQTVSAALGTASA
jgi:hypothetical protein